MPPSAATSTGGRLPVSEFPAAAAVAAVLRLLAAYPLVIETGDGRPAERLTAAEAARLFRVPPPIVVAGGDQTYHSAGPGRDYDEVAGRLVRESVGRVNPPEWLDQADTPHVVDGSR